MHIPTSADFAGRGSSNYIRCAERLQKGRLLVSGGSAECYGDFLGGLYMYSAKAKKAIERLKAFEPADGYYLAYSGGKDSDCIKILAQCAGVKFEAVHNLTTVDAPETVRYVQSQPDVRIDKAYDKNGNHVTMWNLIVKNLCLRHALHVIAVAN